VAESISAARWPAPPRAGGAGASPRRGRSPAAVDLRTYRGRYTSDEAETEFIVVQDARGSCEARPDYTCAMRPGRPGCLRGATLGTVTFRRDAGPGDRLSVKLDRVWDLRSSWYGFRKYGGKTARKAGLEE
jgi:hypothetical protein